MSQRKTMPVPPHQTMFEHQSAVGMMRWLTDLDVEKLHVATCRTRYPATRCECGMFDLFWDETVKKQQS